jgi:hypothetical protein
MRFLLITSASTEWLAGPEATPEVQLPAWEAFARDVAPTLDLRGGNELDHAAAVTVRRTGTSAEGGVPAGEVLGGYLLVEAPDRDEALRIAARTPGVLTGGSVTVVPHREQAA